jgi:hypothetical protein
MARISSLSMRYDPANSISLRPKGEQHQLIPCELTVKEHQRENLPTSFTEMLPSHPIGSWREGRRCLYAVCGCQCRPHANASGPDAGGAAPGANEGLQE